jgi:hypothetical protein
MEKSSLSDFGPIRPGRMLASSCLRNFLLRAELLCGLSARIFVLLKPEISSEGILIF